MRIVNTSTLLQATEATSKALRRRLSSFVGEIDDATPETSSPIEGPRKRTRHHDRHRTTTYGFDELYSASVNGPLSLTIRFQPPQTMRLRDMLDYDQSRPLTLLFDNHRQLFEFTRTVGTAIGREDRARERWVVWLLVGKIGPVTSRPLSPPAKLVWVHRKGRGTIYVRSFPRRDDTPRFAFHVNDAQIRGLDVIGNDSIVSLDVCDVADDNPDAKTMRLLMTFKDRANLRRFVGRARECLVGRCIIDSPTERWHRRGLFVVVRSLRKRRRRSSGELSWSEDEEDETPPVVRRVVSSSEIPENVFRIIIRFL